MVDKKFMSEIKELSDSPKASDMDDQKHAELLQMRQNSKSGQFGSNVSMEVTKKSS